MYSSAKNVQILIALLKQHGIRHAVISPGSRNISIVVSLESDPYFTCYSVVDERSAAYFAVGVSLAKRQPVLLSCTSAQATRNYIPGMTEAYYRGTPLVVVTSDYKLSQIGQGTMQAIDQMSIPVDAAKVSVRLPLVKDSDDADYCARLVNEALLALNHHGPGPVHIDIPIEEQWDGGVPTLPSVKPIDRYSALDSIPPILHERILVSVGQHLPFTERQERALDVFAERFGAVVYTTHLSNYHGRGAVRGGLLVENMDAKRVVEYRPDLLITIGGQIGDYGFDGMMRGADFEHWRVNEDGVIRDTYGRLTKVFELPEEEFFERYAGAPPSGTQSPYAALWAKANARRNLPSELPLSHAYVAGQLAGRLPAESVLHLAILSALRNWSFFELDPSVETYSNVAAFGIDGCLSTFVGHVAATDRLCFLVIGDLSFFYDMGALGIRGSRPNARIVLVNNGGGGEFQLYSHAASQFGDDANTHIAAVGHYGSAKGWAESMGWTYVAVRTKREFTECIEQVVGPADRPIFVEVFTTMQDDSDGVRLIREANLLESLERRIAKRVPSKAKIVAKRVLGRG